MITTEFENPASASVGSNIPVMTNAKSAKIATKSARTRLLINKTIVIANIINVIAVAYEFKSLPSKYTFYYIR